MIKEAIQYVYDKAVANAAPLVTDINGRKYLNHEQHPVKDPLAEVIKVRSLTGFADLIGAAVEKVQSANFVIHVADHRNVFLCARVADAWGRRLNVVQAISDDENRFKFDSFMDHEAFVIGLQANFTGTGDREYLVKIASSLSNETVVTSEDDGIAQKVGLKAGVALKTQETLRPRVKLAPFRTFREADQPASEFLFRVKQQNSEAVPQCALFEADGGKWKLDAMQNIAYFLKGKVPADLPIVF